MLCETAGDESPWAWKIDHGLCESHVVLSICIPSAGADYYCCPAAWKLAASFRPVPWSSPHSSATDASGVELKAWLMLMSTKHLLRASRTPSLATGPGREDVEMAMSVTRLCRVDSVSVHVPERQGSVDGEPTTPVLMWSVLMWSDLISPGLKAPG